MHEIAENPLQTKAFVVETRAARVNPNLRLPARLADLPSGARECVGRLLDDGRIRHLLDDDGSVLVAWSARA